MRKLRMLIVLAMERGGSMGPHIPGGMSGWNHNWRQTGNRHTRTAHGLITAIPSDMAGITRKKRRCARPLNRSAFYGKIAYQIRLACEHPIAIERVRLDSIGGKNVKDHYDRTDSDLR